MQKITTTQRQTLRQSPQQIMVATMIQATTEELQKLIDEEMEKNIVLESDDTCSVDQMSGVSDEEKSDDFDDEEYDDNDEVRDSDISDSLGSDDSYDDGELPSGEKDPNRQEYSPLANYGSDTSFRDAIKAQISELELDDRQLFLANYMIDSLEDDGYLRRPLDELVSDLEWPHNFDTTVEELEEVLVDIIQANAEPAGIGARDLRECLMLQLLDKRSSDVVLNAYKVLDEAFSDFSARKYERIKTRFGLSDRDIQDIQKVIQHLNPYPGGTAASTDLIEARAAQVRPDFIVSNEDGTLTVSLIDCHVPAVRVSQDYADMLAQINKERQDSEDVRKGKAMIEEGIVKANNFINALVQRRRTLLAVMKNIVAFQHEFFLSGKKESLQPMTLKNIAEFSGYDISTISRVTNNRYVQTDFGIFSLKELFTTAITSADGAPAVSNAVIKDALKELVDNEDKTNPLNDDDLQKRLGEMGYPIARRTVVKYRQGLGIPKANERKTT